MRVIRDNPGEQILQSSVVTIGNFDGLHSGHQLLIDRCKELSAGQRPVALISFEPLPAAWFRPDLAPARLMSVRQKLEALRKLGVDLVWLMRFNRTLAQESADHFVQRVMVQTLGAKDVVVGSDFHYGKGREGNTDSLRLAGTESGFNLHVMETLKAEGERVSSSRIRELLTGGEFSPARRLSGRPFRMQGRVIKGRQLGRKLGYPTANIRLASAPSPLHGVFAVRCRWRGNSWHDAVASLGTRPAVGGEEFLVEVHLFDFDDDLYGQRLEVEFVGKLREEQDFAVIDELVEQMRKDEQQARECLLDERTGNT